MADLVVSRPQDIFTNDGNGLSFYISPERVFMAKDINGNTAPVSSLLPSPGGDQNNIDIVKYINLPTLGSITRDLVANLYNNLEEFTVSDIETVNLVGYSYGDTGLLEAILIWKIINKGKGTYGVGGTPLTNSDFFLIVNSGVSLSDIEDNPLTQIYTISDLGGLTVSQYINALDPAVTFQDVNIAPRLIKVTETGFEADYLFLPVGGLYGLGELQTTDADFQLLNSVPQGQNNIQIPVVYTLAEIGASSWEDDIPTLLAAHIASQNITIGETEIYSFEVNDFVKPTFNFDMTSTDWGTIVDADSFKLYLEDQSGESGVVVEDFELIDGRLKCNIYNLLELYVSELNITTVYRCNVETVQFLDLSYNLIDSLTSIQKLSPSITTIDLSHNSISVIEGLDDLINLQELYLSNNSILDIENLDSFVALTNLDMSDNQIRNLTNLSNLVNLDQAYFNNNQLEAINGQLPISCTYLELNFNNFTTLLYTNAESWATLQTAFTNPCSISFSGNPNTPIGTNFQSILAAKNATLTY